MSFPSSFVCTVLFKRKRYSIAMEGYHAFVHFFFFEKISSELKFIMGIGG